LQQKRFFAIHVHIKTRALELLSPGNRTKLCKFRYVKSFFNTSNSNAYVWSQATNVTDGRTDNLPWQYRVTLRFAR